MNSIDETTFPGASDVRSGERWLVMKFGGTSVSSADSWATIRDLIRERVIANTWIYPRIPPLDALRADPESAALLEELNEVVAAQRQWYLDHRDEPLF